MPNFLNNLQNIDDFGLFGPSWRTSWRLPGPSWRPLGGLLSRLPSSWAVLEASWANFEASWRAVVETILHHLGRT
eukprot:9095386-Pyramimonas_sp.AAC.1